MHRMIPASAVVATVAALGACGMPSMAASPEREADARVLLEDLVAGRDDVLAGKMERRSILPSCARNCPL